MEWDGIPTDRVNQSMRWPRAGTVDIDGSTFASDAVPGLVKRAQAELALALLEKNRLQEPKLLGLGFREAKLGTLSVSVDQSQRVALIPDHVVSIVSAVGHLLASADPGDRIMRVTRG